MSREPANPLELPEIPIGHGLRFRLWAACLVGGLVAAAGLLWLVLTPDPGLDADALRALYLCVMGAALLVGVLVALWLDHHVIGHLRGLLVAMQSGQVADLRELPADAGWGELSALGDTVHDRLRLSEREHQAQARLANTQAQLAALQAALMQWRVTGQWQRPAAADAAVLALVDLVGEAVSSRAQVDGNTREAAQRLAGELVSVIHEARETAVNAERGFVEATSLQTSVRELQRLSQELHAALAVPAPAEPTTDPVAERAREALERLVTASTDSVASLGQGLVRVQDVSEQVQRLANRATLIAIQALSGSGDPAAFADELKQLARDVRDATDRTQRYATEIDEAVRDADATMRDARRQALEQLTVPEPLPAASPAARQPDVQRLMERVLEMVQDASAKGERVSGVNEHASSLAERLSRRLQGSVLEAGDLVVRLTPTADTGAAAPREASVAEARDLHLVEPPAPVESVTEFGPEGRRP
jgi:hypothetical protein